MSRRPLGQSSAQIRLSYYIYAAFARELRHILVELVVRSLHGESNILGSVRNDHKPLLPAPTHLGMATARKGLSALVDKVYARKG